MQHCDLTSDTYQSFNNSKEKFITCLFSEKKKIQFMGTGEELLLALNCRLFKRSLHHINVKKPQRKKHGENW